MVIGSHAAKSRKKVARKKREIITRELSPEEREALLDALLKPPLAISVAILGALAVEHELDISIKARLRKIPQQEWEEILSDKEGPLGNFDRKIKFASYLGVLDTIERKNLDIIRNVRNRFAHTKRLISFDHSFIADELRKIAALKGRKKQFARIPVFDPETQYTILCFHSITHMSKKRYGNRTAAYKAWLKRQKYPSPMSGLAGLYSIAPTSLGSPPATPISTLPLPKQKTGSGPSGPTPLGLLSGLLPYLDDNKDKP